VRHFASLPDLVRIAKAVLTGSVAVALVLFMTPAWSGYRARSSRPALGALIPINSTPLYKDGGGQPHKRQNMLGTDSRRLFDIQ